MIDLGTRIKNRVHTTHDLRTLWQKLRDEGFMVYEDEEYMYGEQAPDHLYHIETGDGQFVADVHFRDYTEKELQESRELGLTPFLQEVQWIEY